MKFPGEVSSPVLTILIYHPDCSKCPEDVFSNKIAILQPSITVYLQPLVTSKPPGRNHGKLSSCAVLVIWRWGWRGTLPRCDIASS